MSYHLALFFTYGVSLKMWHDSGMFHREVALYKKLQELGITISFITYGTNDQQYHSEMSGITIHDNYFRVPNNVYSRLLPFLHMNILRKADVYKTNQFKGGEFAQLASRIWRKPLIARAGYNWLELMENSSDADTSTLDMIRKKEQDLIKNSASVVVTTHRIGKYMQAQNPEQTIRVHPNYVLTDTFYPMESTKQYDIVFVGRIHQEKNLKMLFDAMRLLDGKRLLMIGQGDLADSLKHDYADLSDRVTWYGSAPHDELPSLIQQARIFVLPSHHEGHPKALIEAMSCGMAVVGTDVPGIQEVIQHEKTGFLCEKTPDDIAQTIQYILDDDALQQSLGRQAREYALENYSLDRIADLEIEAIKLAVG